MARTTVPPRMTINGATHVKVSFGWNAIYLLPVQEAALLLNLMVKAIKVDHENMGDGYEMYMPCRDQGITIEYLNASAQTLPAGIGKQGKEYREAFKATKTMRGDDADMSDFTYDQFAAANQPVN